MNDYSFGNRIMTFRTKSGLSQNDLAKLLGVTNKAVSKWETGVSKPQLDVIRKLSNIFGVSCDELLSLIDNKIKKVTKIVITGGPCAGKTTAMCWIQNAFTTLGYYVIFVPETATELITAGITPWTMETNLEYQKSQLLLQIDKEKIYENAANKIYNYDKVLIIYDRGTMDNKAYMSNIEFSTILNELKLNEIELRDNYDAVFHLVSAAKGASEYYTLDNNIARSETIEEATEIDDKLIASWTGHPHFRVIDNSTDFEDKMKRLIKEITSFLGEPEPYEIERKFLIEYPDIKSLTSNPSCRSIEIIQTYLKTDNDDEIRLRQRGENGNFVYFKTIKKKVNDIKRVEIESRLSKDEYLNLLMDADTSKRQIRKTRYCLTYKNQYFEIDVFPFWKDRAIIEIELSDENDNIEFPNYIKIIKEVTSDDNYKNISLASIK